MRGPQYGLVEGHRLTGRAKNGAAGPDDKSVNAAPTAALASHTRSIGMTINNVLASVPVKDLAAARAWYSRVLGRTADSNPMPEVAEWRFERGGWLQVYAGPERAGGGSFTLAVDDMDQTLSDLRALGFDVSDQAYGKQARVVMIKDPDGNSIAFAQTDDPSMAR